MMKYWIVAVLMITMVGFFACDHAKEVKDEKRLSGVVAETGGVSNADLIRNPASARGSDTQAALPIIEFEVSEYQFGTISEGEIVEHTFSFTNTGEGPLIIQRATSGCGCTVPAWPRAPILPGESGEITVRFDSTNRPGARRQAITIEANTLPPQTQVYIVGHVDAAG